MDLIAFPLDITKYTAKSLGAWCGTRTRGIYSAERHFETTAKGGMNVSISSGQAWLKMTDNWGVSVPLEESISLTLDTANASFPRIDAVCVRLDKNRNTGEIIIKKGTPGAKPTVPKIVQNDPDFDEIFPATIYVEAGAKGITPANITDTRLDEALCGLMRDGVTRLPTDMLQKQASGLLETIAKDIVNFKEEEKAAFLAWFLSIQNILDENAAATLLNMIKANQQEIISLVIAAFGFAWGSIQDGFFLEAPSDFELHPHGTTCVRVGFYEPLETDSNNPIMLDVGGTVLAPLITIDGEPVTKISGETFVTAIYMDGDSSPKWIVQGTQHRVAEAGIAPWGGITNKPSSYPPSTHTHTPSQVGLGNVQNTADSAKSVYNSANLGGAAAATFARKNIDNCFTASQTINATVFNHRGGVIYLGDMWGASGQIVNTAHQQLFIAASNETYGRLFLGVREGAWTFCPDGNGNVRLGSPSYRFSQIYSTSSTISTSDKRHKKDISDMDDDFVIGMVEGLRPVQYRLLDGESGRLHIGFIAQEVEALLENLGRTSMDFAGFIKSPASIEQIETEEYIDMEPYTATEEYVEIDKKGKSVSKIREVPSWREIIKEREVTRYEQSETEFIYGLRYEEFIALLYRYNQIKAAQQADLAKELTNLKAEMAAMVKRMTALEKAK